ncbi:glycoside hydrolase family 28 protein [Phocaeicola plebeius]|uniref:Glycoside hydrolase family 28 protein n=1 Tax=Phocaeicola plebeius TaxID=310297 RepID=A0A921HK94_9BACT|nr:glycosyl hydrolase family 28-related protein [Phocaeicola plebeius]HJF81993.1 glycoside hydrolase family 28 protein [Phocaeicola plebeius]
MKKRFIFILCGLFLCAGTIAATNYNVLQQGAVGDGKTLNTKSLQSAIDALHAKGGGQLYFPAGRYLTGSLQLKSNVTLYLEKEAVLLGSTSPYDYPGFSTEKELKVNNDHFDQALIYAEGAENIGITGEGCIDGQGRELALTIDSLHVENRAYWNNDGINISDCKEVRISNCFINSADDGICLKSHNRGAWNDRVSISNCHIISSASAIKFGTESLGGFKNVTIDNIRVKDTFRSAIAIESVDGAEIENVQVSNVHAVNTGNAIFIRLGHRSGEQPGYLRNVTIKDVYVEVPFGRPDINYDLRGPAVTFFHNPFPSSISGIPGHDIENVKLENIEIVCPGRATRGMAYMSVSRLKDVPENEKGYPEFTMFEELPSWGFYVRHVKGIQMHNIKLRLQEDDFRPAFVFDRVSDVRLSDISLPENKKAGQVVLRQTNLQSADNVVKEYVREVE